MYCPNCKIFFPDEPGFCGFCGAPLIENPERVNKWDFVRGILCGLLIVAVIGGAVLGVLALQNLEISAPRGCGSPEAAVSAYFDAAKAGDAEGMLNTFSLQEYADHMVPEKAPGKEAPSEAGSSLLRSRNADLRRSTLLRQLETICLYTALPDLGRDGAVIGGQTSASGDRTPYKTPEAFIKQLEGSDVLKQLSSIKVRKILCTEDLHLEKNSPLDRQIRRSFREYAAQTRGDEFKEYLVEYEIGGKTCYRDMVVVRYGGKWYNYQPCGALSDALGDPETGILSRNAVEDAGILSASRRKGGF